MEVGQLYTISITGKCVKKELYKDDVVRVWIQNDESNEMAIVKENKDVSVIT